MSIESLRRTGSCRFLIALLTLASWPGVAATQDSTGAAPLNSHMRRAEQKGPDSGSLFEDEGGDGLAEAVGVALPSCQWGGRPSKRRNRSHIRLFPSPWGTT
jgi:hypothetical protein